MSQGVAGRRTVLGLTALAMLGQGAGPSRAQGGGAAWPSRPLRMVVPFPPGGTTDLLARLLTDGLGSRLGQPVVAENRGGAGGAVGAEMAARMEPDGYNLFFGTIGSAAIIPQMYAKLNWRPSDLVPVALFAEVPNVLCVARNAPWANLQALIADAKARPGKLTYASSGIGSSLHLSGELLKAMADLDILHVPFRGGSDTANEVLSGRINMGVNNLPSAIGLIRSGELRALAVTSAERSPAVPDVPTVAESGLPGYEATAWFGLQVPAGTPQAIIARLNAETNAILANPATRSRIDMVGARARGGSIEDFAAYIRAENTKWAEVVRRAGVRVE
jgi:tripartite-type tricarboxylate transporter receptor subunit TctC